MRQLIQILPLLFLISCSNPTTEHQAVHSAINPDTSSISITNNIKDTQTDYSDTLITERFLRFAQFLDSSGYSCDTLRLKKTYNIPNDNKKITIDKYNFYLYPPGKNSLDWRFETASIDTLVSLTLNKKLFSTVISVESYFYTQKTPEIKYGEKWYIDGIIDEWKFPDNNSAKIGAIELINKQDEIYFHMQHHLVCYVDNYVYVFSTRGSWAWNSITLLFEQFVKDNGAIIPSELESTVPNSK